MLTQLIRVTQAPPAPLIDWAAATAAVQALAFLAGSVPETAGSTLELGRPDLTMRLRSWPPHPECGCGWSPTTEWGA